MTNPPSFPPKSPQPRPSSHGAARVGRGSVSPVRRPVLSPQEWAARPDGLAERLAPRAERGEAAKPVEPAAPVAPVEHVKPAVQPPIIPPAPPVIPPARSSAYTPAPAYAPAQTRASAGEYSVSSGTAHANTAAPVGGVHDAPSAPLLPQRTKRPLTPRRIFKRVVISFLSIILVLAIAIGGWVAYLFKYGDDHLAHVEALSSAPDTGGVTYLIAGSDRRQAGAIDDGTEGQRSDSIILLHKAENGQVSLVSLPRDTYVKIPGYRASKLNSAFSHGGPKLLVETVEQLTHLKIDHFVEVSMGGVRDLVDAVGGINLCSDLNVHDQFSGLVWTPGCHDVDGTTALAFSRMRYSDPRGDIGRTERQRQVIGKLAHKVLTPSTFINPFKQKELLAKGIPTVMTDPDTGMWALGQAVLAMREVLGPNGLVGTPPIADLNYKPGGVGSTVLLAKSAPEFFKKLADGTLTPADFQAPK